jgi:hypothetical protein
MARCEPRGRMPPALKDRHYTRCELAPKHPGRHTHRCADRRAPPTGIASGPSICTLLFRSAIITYHVAFASLFHGLPADRRPSSCEKARSPDFCRYVEREPGEKPQRAGEHYGALLLPCPDGAWIETRGTGPSTLRTTFRIDGKEHAREGLPGFTVSWKEVAPNTWESVSKRDGRVTSTIRHVISNDGKRLTITITRRTEAGKDDVTTYVYERTSGTGSGLLGNWKRVSEESKSAGTMRIEVANSGELTVRQLYSDARYTAKLDAKEYPYTGRGILPNITVTVQAVDARTLRVTYLRDHKPIFENTVTVSSDGNNLTVARKDPNTKDQPSTSVYEKQ